MTDEQREEIKRLSIVANEAANRLHWADYQNTAREPDAAAAQSARRGVLSAEASEARFALEAAIAALGKPAEPWVHDLASEMIRAARLAAA